MGINGKISTKYTSNYFLGGITMAKTALEIENRIALLKSRPQSNTNIIKKLERRLRALDTTK